MQYARFARQESVNRGWNNFISAMDNESAEGVRTCIIIKSRLSLIVRVNVVLNRNVVVDSD